VIQRSWPSKDSLYVVTARRSLSNRRFDLNGKNEAVIPIPNLGSAGNARAGGRLTPFRDVSYTEPLHGSLLRAKNQPMKTAWEYSPVHRDIESDARVRNLKRRDKDSADIIFRRGMKTRWGRIRASYGYAVMESACRQILILRAALVRSRGVYVVANIRGGASWRRLAKAGNLTKSKMCSRLCGAAAYLIKQITPAGKNSRSRAEATVVC